MTETHVHADYLSGSRELAARTGARLWLSAMGDEEPPYRFEGRPLRDGDEIRVGDVELRAVHTPGHTPEHLSFLVTDRATGDRPHSLLSGDFVFVGDVGRPDLLDEAAGGKDTRFAGARQLFDSLRDRFLTLPDHVQVWPGHGAGSACGKALGAVPVTTVGYERSTAREILFLDTRTLAEWQADPVDGALFVPFGTNFATYASYAIDPEQDDLDVVVFASGPQQAAVMRDKLAWIGIDRFAGYVTELAPFTRSAIDVLDPRDLHGRLGSLNVLDVRTATEHAGGHFGGALQLHAGRVRGRLAEISREGTVLAHCQGGGRAAVAASILRRHGWSDVAELNGGYDGWVDHLRTTQGTPA